MVIQHTGEKQPPRLFHLQYTAHEHALAYNSPVSLVYCEAYGVVWPDGMVMLWHDLHNETYRDNRHPQAHHMVGFATMDHLKDDYAPFDGVVMYLDEHHAAEGSSHGT